MDDDASRKIDCLSPISGIVTAIVPTFNRAHFLQECIDSLLEQSVPISQLIVVDDGSTDSTQSVLQSYGKCLTILTKSNAGKATALNLALPRVESKYVWFFDDDDVALRHAVELRLSVLESAPKIAFCGSGHYVGRSGVDGQIVIQRRARVPVYPASENFYRLLEDCYFTLPSALIRTTSAKSIGCFDESLVSSEDYDFLIRLAHRYDYGVIPEPTFIVREHLGVRGSARSSYPAADRRRQFLATDQQLGRRIRADVKIEMFNFNLTGLAGELTRECFLRRGVVMASKGLQVEAMQDLKAAFQADRDGPLTQAEEQLFRDVVAAEFFWDSLLADPGPFFSAMHLLWCEGGCQRQAARQMRRGLLTLMRDRSVPWGQRFGLAWLLLRLSIVRLRGI